MDRFRVPNSRPILAGITEHRIANTWINYRSRPWKRSTRQGLFRILRTRVPFHGAHPYASDVSHSRGHLADDPTTGDSLLRHPGLPLSGRRDHSPTVLRPRLLCAHWGSARFLFSALPGHTIADFEWPPSAAGLGARDGHSSPIRDALASYACVEFAASMCAGYACEGVSVVESTHGHHPTSIACHA